MTAHSIVDLFALGILLYCACQGGFTWVAFTTRVGDCAVVVLQIFRHPSAAIEPMIGVDPPLKQWLAMLAVYVALCGVSFVVAGILNSWLAKAKVIDFDKHLGGILGFVKGIVICMTIMFFAITMSPPMRNVVSQTYSGYAAARILNTSQYLIPLLPENAVPTVRNVIDNFNKSLQPGTDDLSAQRLLKPTHSDPIRQRQARLRTAETALICPACFPTGCKVENRKLAAKLRGLCRPPKNRHWKIYCVRCR